MYQPAAHAARFELASRPSRLLGQVLDGVVAAAPLLAAVIVAAVIVAPLSESMGNTIFLVALAASLGYHFFADCLGKGQSYGKRWLGMAVVHADTGAPCTPGQSFVRNLTLALLGPIDSIFILGSRHQRLGHMLARTLVVEAPRGGW
jgi:uncharacterized RDD family membrane protein YckC